MALTLRLKTAPLHWACLPGRRVWPCERAPQRGAYPALALLTLVMAAELRLMKRAITQAAAAGTVVTIIIAIIAVAAAAAISTASRRQREEWVSANLKHQQRQRGRQWHQCPGRSTPHQRRVPMTAQRHAARLLRRCEQRSDVYLRRPGAAVVQRLVLVLARVKLLQHRPPQQQQLQVLQCQADLKLRAAPAHHRMQNRRLDSNLESCEPHGTPRHQLQLQQVV